MNFEEHENKNFREFIKMMKSRFKSGRRQYGMDYLMKDQIKDIEEELVDVAVYAMLLFNKVRMMKCLK